MPMCLWVRLIFKVLHDWLHSWLLWDKDDEKSDETKSPVRRKVGESSRTSPPVPLAADGPQGVLFSPPCLTKRLVWATVKGEVGRQYTHRTTMSFVFNPMQGYFVYYRQGCIKKANKHLKTLREHLEEVERDRDMESEAKCNESDSFSDF